MFKKHCVFIILILLLLCFGQTAYAEEGYLGYEGGLTTYKDVDPKKTKIDYYEYTFVTGKPVILTGTVDCKLKSTKTQESISYTYDIKNDKGDIAIKRTVKITGKIIEQPNETISKEYQITGYTENLTVNGSVYKLSSWSFTKSSAVDRNPSVNFFQGAWELEKRYENGMKISISGENYGYDGYWGNGEFQKLRMFISTNEWEGYIDENITLVQKTIIEFRNNITPSSINGTYLLKSQIQGNMDITYDLPLLNKNNQPTSVRIKNKVNKKVEKSPTVKMAIIPFLPKVKGNVNEIAINTMFTFNGFDTKKEFIPNEYITRAEYAKLILDGLNIYSNYYNPKTTRKTTLYKDVPTNHPYYGYIYAATKSNIMTGSGGGYFKPDNYISKAEASLVIAKALGFNKKISQEAVVTQFADDITIPAWVRDSVYLLKDANIVDQDENNNFQPNKKITKAEAAQLIYNMINYLREDIANQYMNLTIFH